MSESSSEVNPLDALAEEFVSRWRAGERPSLDEFIARRPDLADDIRDLFPGLVVMEGVRPDRADTTGPFAPGPAPTLKRLGDFRILREVGRGGMGVVYEAEQESLGRHVALKVLPAHALLDPQRLRRFQREAKAAARLHHTNIVPVYGVGEQDGLHYYVMQFIQGQGLDQVLDELKALRQKRQGTAAGPAKHSGAESAALSLLTGRFASGAAVEPSPVADAPGSPDAGTGPAKTPESSGRSDTGRAYWGGVARIGIQTAQALAYAAAQGTLHRDVKPSNLLLDAHGNLWVTDFGLAKAADSEDLTHTGDIVGTLRYMAPERFSGKGDLRSDLYSIGLTLYELLALRPAFEAPDRQQLVHQVLHAEPPRLRQLDRAVPCDLETIVHKAIDRDPARRYQTAEDLADDLQRFLDDRPIRARRVGAVEKLWRWGRRNPVVAILSAAVGLLLIGSSFGGAVAAYHFRMLAADERKAHADADAASKAADAARKEADDNAGRLRDRMAALYEVNALIERGRAHEASREWEQALADLTKAVERMPEYALVWRARCELYYHLGLEQEALADGARVMELNEPDDPEAWFHYAGLRLQQGDAAGYRAVCARMREKFGDDDKVEPTWLAMACCLGPDPGPIPRTLIRQLESAVRENPKDVLAQRVLAALYYRCGQDDKAASLLTDVDDLNSLLSRGGVLAWEVAALIDHAKGLDDRAKRLLQEVDDRLERLNTNLLPFDASGDERWLNIEEQEGEPLYREAVEAVRGVQSQGAPGAWERRARSHHWIGQKEKAVADLTRALQRTPDDPKLFVWRARLYTDMDQRDGADADLARFAGLKAPSAPLWAEACLLPTGRQDWDAAADLACQALDVLGDQVVNFYPCLGNHSALLTRVAQRRPNDFRLRMGVANHAATNGDSPKAIEWVTDALRLKPDDAEAISVRANFNAQLGRWRDAAADFDHLLKVRPPRNADELLPLALLRAYLDDRDGYREACRRMVEQYGKDEAAAWVVAEALTLAPNDAADPAETKKRITPIPEKYKEGGWLLTYALACLRAGKDEDVLQHFDLSHGRPAKAEPEYELAKALAYHRLGRAERARDCWNEADRIIDERTQPYPGDAQAKALHLGGGWSVVLRLLILRREVDAALNAPHRREAEECLRNKQWNEAVDHLNALLKADPAFWPDLVARGVAYEVLGDQDKAKVDFRKARDIRLNGPYFSWTRGRLYAEAGLLDQAAEDFAEILSPSRASYEVRQETYTDLTRDEPLLLAVAAMRPSDHELRMSCGSLVEQQGKWKAALRLYGEAMRLEGPNDKKWPATLEHGRLAAQHEQWADAASDYSRLYERDRSKSLLGFQAALLLLQTGDADRYRKTCRSLQKDLENLPVEGERMGFLWCCVGPEAVDNYAPLLKLAEGKRELLATDWGWVQFAALRYRAGQFQEADRLFEERAELDASTFRYAVHGWLFRAMTAHRLGRAEDARRWLEKAANWMSDAEQAKLPPKEQMAAWAWNERLELSLLRREAEALLKAPAPEQQK
jgi:serine/threonine protein kinase/Tfp pilus assembly protein PilF